MKIVLSLIITGLIGTSTGNAQTPLENRVKTLEKKVAILEALVKSKGLEKPEASASDKSDTNIVFYDGFEKGTANWEEKFLFVPPHKSESMLKLSAVASYDVCRATKTLKSESGLIEPAKGNRFLTTASASSGISQIVSKSEKAFSNWRGIRYVILKSGFSIKGMEFPVARFHAHLQEPADKKYEKLPRGLFEVGYVIENADIKEFHSLVKIPKGTKGWEEYEVDLSKAPKDKKIHLVFSYLSADSRYSPTVGMQLDEVIVLDDK